MRNLSRLACLLLLLAVFLRLFAAQSWFCELSTAFTLPQVGLAVVLAIVFLALRDWPFLAASLAMAAWVGVALFPYLPQGKPAHSATTEEHIELRVMLANVFTGNDQHALVVEAIREEQPDILCIQELDDRLIAGLEPVTRDYPYAHMDSRPDNFGIGLWSKHPFNWVETRDLGDATVPAILAKINIEETTLALLNIHTLPPIMGDYADTRNQQLDAIAGIVEELGRPFLLIGDLNITMWSPHYRRMMRDSGLLNARVGFALAPTWPVAGPRIPAFAPIDHILTCPEISVLDFRRGPYTGSDHFPIAATLRIPKAEPAT
ncbi:MAG: hypothetical protein RLZZ303_877 [Candidatus Hydrogenedentota bacterium]